MTLRSLRPGWLTLRNRNSAAYKGVYARLLCESARD